MKITAELEREVEQVSENRYNQARTEKDIKL